jgi:hypothetical protein
LWAIHWMQNEMWARLKTHKSWCVQQFLKFLIIKISQILCSWHMFKVWLLISNSTLFKDIMFWSNQLHVNYKSHVYQPYYHYLSHQGLEKLEVILCMLLFKSAWFTFKCIWVSHFHSTTTF